MSVYNVTSSFLRFSWLSKCLKWCFLIFFVFFFVCLPHNLHSWHELMILKEL